MPKKKNTQSTGYLVIIITDIIVTQSLNEVNMPVSVCALFVAQLVNSCVSAFLRNTKSQRKENCNRNNKNNKQ